ncbi:MAG: hypothetical protein H6609_20430, partial [Ignavibacteriales bacterium]|nr:hypothetical protein [Ignavibacteriales bacterium]
MRKHILFWLITLGFILISCSKDEFPTKFSTSPEKPKKNEEITIKYKSDISKLNNSDKLEMIVYSYGTDLFNTNKIQLAKKGEGWIGKFTPEDNATGLVVKIKNADTTDNNNELGYVVKLYNDDGEELA